MLLLYRQDRILLLDQMNLMCPTHVIKFTTLMTDHDLNFRMLLTAEATNSVFIYKFTLGSQISSFARLSEVLDHDDEHQFPI